MEDIEKKDNNINININLEGLSGILFSNLSTKKQEEFINYYFNKSIYQGKILEDLIYFVSPKTLNKIKNEINLEMEEIKIENFNFEKTDLEIIKEEKKEEEEEEKIERPKFKI